MSLNKEKGASPLYYQLYEILKDKIKKEIYSCGDILPSEKELMKEYEVSRITVRQAISNLTQDGYLEAKRGIGTIVRYKKIDEQIKSIRSFSEEMQEHGIIMKTSFCSVKEIKASSKIALYLNVNEGDKCLEIKRIRCAGDIPIVYSETYIRKDLNLDTDERYYTDSFYKYLKEEKNIIVHRAHDTLEAASANKKIAKLLEINEKDPVFIRVRQSFNKDNDLIEHTTSYYPGEKYKYSMDL